MKFLEKDRLVKYMKIIVQVMFVYSFFFVGNWLHTFFKIPLPGSIIGLLLLLAALLLKVFPLSWIESGTTFLLSFLPLFLIPATVGAIDYGHVFAGKGSLLILIVMISTLLTMGISSHVSQYFAKKSDKRKEDASCKQH